MLPLVPVIRYLLVNKDILSLLDVVVLLAACLGISFVLVVAIPALLSRYSPTRLLASVAGAFAFTIMNMASVSGLLHWLGKGNIKTQLFLFALALVITWLLLGLRNTKDLAFVVVAFLLGSAAIQLLTESYPATPAAYNESRLAELVAGRQPSRTPTSTCWYTMLTPQTRPCYSTASITVTRKTSWSNRASRSTHTPTRLAPPPFLP